MLIIEGADRVGKTTLCHKLVEALAPAGPWMYRHFGPLPESWYHPWDYFPHMSRHVVQDRFHLSEWVYRRAEGQTNPNLTFEKYRLVDAQLRLLGGVTVVITASQKIITDRGGDQRAVIANRLFSGLPRFTDIDFHYHVNKHDNDYSGLIYDVLKKYSQRQNLTRRLQCNDTCEKSRK